MTPSPDTGDGLVEAGFWLLVDKRGPDDCWPWLGSTIKKDGRGSYCTGGKRYVASRYALALTSGGMPEPTVLACHSCDNPPCCNPAHLWWGTTAENRLDASAKGRLPNNRVTHCPQGHPYSGDNLKIVKGNQRRCYACTQTYKHSRRVRLRAEGRYAN